MIAYNYFNLQQTSKIILYQSLRHTAAKTGAKNITTLRGLCNSKSGKGRVNRALYKSLSVCCDWCFLRDVSFKPLTPAGWWMWVTGAHGGPVRSPCPWCPPESCSLAESCWSQLNSTSLSGSSGRQPRSTCCVELEVLNCRMRCLQYRTHLSTFHQFVHCIVETQSARDELTSLVSASSSRTDCQTVDQPIRARYRRSLDLIHSHPF